MELHQNCFVNHQTVDNCKKKKKKKKENDKKKRQKKKAKVLIIELHQISLWLTVKMHQVKEKRKKCR